MIGARRVDREQPAGCRACRYADQICQTRRGAQGQRSAVEGSGFVYDGRSVVEVGGSQKGREREMGCGCKPGDSGQLQRGEHNEIRRAQAGNARRHGHRQACVEQAVLRGWDAVASSGVHRYDGYDDGAQRSRAGCSTSWVADFLRGGAGRTVKLASVFAVLYPFARRRADAFAAWCGKGPNALLAGFCARIAIGAHSPFAAVRWLSCFVARPCRSLAATPRHPPHLAPVASRRSPPAALRRVKTSEFCGGFSLPSHRTRRDVLQSTRSQACMTSLSSFEDQQNSSVLAAGPTKAPPQPRQSPQRKPPATRNAVDPGKSHAPRIARRAPLARLVFRLCAKGTSNGHQEILLETPFDSAYNSRLRLVFDGYTRARGIPESRGAQPPQGSRRQSEPRRDKGFSVYGEACER